MGWYYNQKVGADFLRTPKGLGRIEHEGRLWYPGIWSGDWDDFILLEPKKSFGEAKKEVEEVLGSGEV